ncbi:hypothetical protein DIJ63_06105 [Burkholderia pseudomallei]|nr:hypothetical protein DIJ62_11020 [Burkholderia pseudomallei]TPB76848.1 hypothetical protein DIJ63_06105 [Burkholderia pseudomallei]
MTSAEQQATSDERPTPIGCSRIRCDRSLHRPTHCGRFMPPDANRSPASRAGVGRGCASG